MPGPLALLFRAACGGTIYGMTKTTIYLPDELKRGVERLAAERRSSEAEVIREAIRAHVASSRPSPSVAYIAVNGLQGKDVDELLDGFGER